MDSFDALTRSADWFTHNLAQVTSPDWDKPTPCTEWNVRDVANHVVGGNIRYRMLLEGAPADAMTATRSQDHLGDDWVTNFELTARGVALAFREEGALLRTVHHPTGDRTGTELIEMRIVEYAIHGWDLARALGLAEELDAEIVEHLLEKFALLERGGREGHYVPMVSLAEGQTRLLAYVGRS